MELEFDYVKRYDELLDVKPNHGYDRVIPPVKYNYVGLEIEIAVEFDRGRYSFIRTMLKKIKQAVGENGYFTKDGTIIGDYNFEIVLDPMSIKKTKKIYSDIMKVVEFSDGSICFDKEHNCGLHMNFNQFDIENINEAHQRLLILMNQKSQYFEENVYKRRIYNFDFEDYLKFQKEVGDKYVAINYLDKKVVEVRNIKTGLSAKYMESVMRDIINALFPGLLPEFKECKDNKRLIKIFSSAFEESNKKIIRESLNNDYLVIKITKKGPKVVRLTDNIINAINESEE